MSVIDVSNTVWCTVGLSVEGWGWGETRFPLAKGGHSGNLYRVIGCSYHQTVRLLLEGTDEKVGDGEARVTG